MKKIYVSPSLKVVKVELTQMIADSIRISESNYNGSTDIESRRGGGSVWDDDDDDY